MLGQEVFLLDAVRTPFGKLRGGLSHVRTDDLAAAPLRELMARHPGLDPATVEDVYYGNTNGAGEENRNVARMAALLAGLPVTVPGATTNRLCASGSEALVQAARAVAVGDARLVVAGGVEGMSRAPYVLPKPDEALPRRMELHQTTVGWRMVNPAFPDEWTASLGASAEAVASARGIGREEMDEYAVRSHHLVHAAFEAGHHDGFVVPLEGVERDESLRPEASMQTLGALRPAFTKDGTVTAGNSSPINDGALAALIGTAEVAEELGVEPVARIVGSRTVALSPELFAVAPVPAVRQLLERTGVGFDDVDLWEVNEAFAAMVLSTLHELPELDPSIVNVNGGAIAIGHPLGASAPRIVVDLARELKRRGGGIGVAAACIGVGQGTAVMLEVPRG